MTESVPRTTARHKARVTRPPGFEMDKGQTIEEGIACRLWELYTRDLEVDRHGPHFGRVRDAFEAVALRGRDLAFEIRRRVHADGIFVSFSTAGFVSSPRRAFATGTHSAPLDVLRSGQGLLNADTQLRLRVRRVLEWWEGDSADCRADLSRAFRSAYWAALAVMSSKPNALPKFLLSGALRCSDDAFPKDPVPEGAGADEIERVAMAFSSVAYQIGTRLAELPTDDELRAKRKGGRGRLPRKAHWREFGEWMKANHVSARRVARHPDALRLFNPGANPDEPTLKSFENLIADRVRT